VLFLCDSLVELLIVQRMMEDEAAELLLCGGRHRRTAVKDGGSGQRRRMDKEANPSLKKTKQEKCLSLFRGESSREMDLPPPYVWCERNWLVYFGGYAILIVKKESCEMDLCFPL
jgi:hypothetical protein